MSTTPPAACKATPFISTASHRYRHSVVLWTTQTTTRCLYCTYVLVRAEQPYFHRTLTLISVYKAAPANLKVVLSVRFLPGECKGWCCKRVVNDEGYYGKPDSIPAPFFGEQTPITLQYNAHANASMCMYTKQMANSSTMNSWVCRAMSARYSHFRISLRCYHRVVTEHWLRSTLSNPS